MANQPIDQELTPPKPNKPAVGSTTDASVAPEKLTGKTPFIDAKTAVEAYAESKFWYWRYFDPIDEFERIARNKPSTAIDPSLPKVTDGTTAAVVQEDPKRIIQQVPDGLVGCKKYPQFAKIADIVLRDELIPMYNRMGNMLQKSWNMTSKAMTWGVASSYTFFTSTEGKFHTDFSIPYVKDVLGEKGKVFLPDCNIRFMRSWYQRRDILGIIKREQALEQAKKGYKSEWDLKALAQFLEAGATQKPANLMTPAEREKGGDTGGYEVIHAFQSGVGASFYSFSPLFEQGKPLRTKINPDPRGVIPINDMYCNIDLSNPLGRGVVELSGGVQNLIDQQMQMFQFLTTMLMGPPLQVWGTVNKSMLKFRPNALWDMGNAATNKVEPYEVHNHAVDTFPNVYGLLKSQIMNLNPNQDSSVSSTAGNPSFSKTQAGVEAQQNRLGVSDNYLRKQFEAWFEEQSETSVNIYFAEMRGKHSIQLDADDRADIAKTPSAKYVDKKGVLTFDYSDINKVTFQFDVDPSSSEVKEDQDNVEKLTEVLKVMQEVQDPTVQAAVPKVVKLIIDEIGAEGVDDIFPSDTDANGNPVQGAQGQPGAQQVTPQMVMQMIQAAMQQQQANDPGEHPLIKLMTALQIKFGDLPEDSKREVLQAIGIPTNMASPAQQQIDLKAQQQQGDTILKADKQAHDTTLAVHQQAHNQAQDKLNATQNAQSQAMQGQQAAQQAQAQAEQQEGGSGESEDSEPAAEEASEPAEGNMGNQPAMAGPMQSKGQQPDPSRPLDPQEQEIVELMFKRGFSEQEAEAAITMLRQGVPEDQIVRKLGGKNVEQSKR